MKNLQINPHDAALKLKAIDWHIKEGNGTTAHEFGINEFMFRHWF